MGKASRRKRDARAAEERPRWAGAYGFDRAWRLMERYAASGPASLPARPLDPMPSPDDPVALTAYCNRNANLHAAMVRVIGESAIVTGAKVESMLNADPKLRTEERAPRAPKEVSELDGFGHARTTAAALGAIAERHGAALRTATPILFDPLGAPELDGDAFEGLRLPFDTVTCDFTASSGMGMPLESTSGDRWIGLVAATFVQQGEAIDVWPVITVMDASKPDHKQTPRAVAFGCARFGGMLPPAPPGLERVDVHGISVWRMDERDVRLDPNDAPLPADDFVSGLWLVVPAFAAASALRLLDAINVTLAPAALTHAELRRAGREGADIPLEVVVHTKGRQAATGTPSTSGIDWQHRWMVRGHWKHFRRGPVFNANARKRVHDADGIECVKVWCPPFVKGPDDAPMVLKARRVRS